MCPIQFSKYRLTWCISLIEVNNLMAVGGEIWTAVTSEDEYMAALFLCACQDRFVCHSQCTALSSSSLVIIQFSRYRILTFSEHWVQRI